MLFHNIFHFTLFTALCRPDKYLESFKEVFLFMSAKAMCRHSLIT